MNGETCDSNKDANENQYAATTIKSLLNIGRPIVEGVENPIFTIREKEVKCVTITD